MPIDSINGFLSEYLIKWLSVEPQMFTFAHHLQCLLPSRLEIAVFQPRNPFARICHKLLPTASVVYANIGTVLQMLHSKYFTHETTTFKIPRKL